MISPSVMPLEQPEVMLFDGAALLAVPFQVGECREWLPKVVASLASTPLPKGTKKVLAFHLGVIDKDTPSFLAKAQTFGFAIPAGATITGVVVTTLARYATNAATWSLMHGERLRHAGRRQQRRRRWGAG